MSYLVLARKFRPQTFQSIIGQEHITRALANSILWGRVAHAFLFTGPRGVGKTTTARVLARALNCTGRPLPEASAVPADGNSAQFVEPCGECTNCKEIARSASIAVWEIDGASNNSVENVRELIDSLRSLPPPGSKYKIYIIDEVHMLSTAAFNALLKSLEEPPANTIFIFATTEPQKIPETVISRCQRHDFRKISVAVISDSLRAVAAQEGIEAEEEVFEFIALKARGGMRDAQSMFDRFISFSTGKLDLKTAQQLFGVVDTSYYFRLSEAVFAQDVETCLQLIDEAFQQSIDVRAFIADFLTHWRNLLLLSLTMRSGKGGEAKIVHALEVTKRDLAALKKQVETVQAFDAQRLFELAEKTSESALASNFPRYVFEAGVAKMATLPDLRPLADILTELKSASLGKNLGPNSGGSGGGKNTKPLMQSGEPVRGTPGFSAQKASDVFESSKEPTPQIPPLSDPSVQSESTAISADRNGAFADRGLLVEEVEDSESDFPEGKPSTFNPSWQDFIHYVRNGRNEVMLATFLKRVSPKTFLEGRLAVEGGEFDIQSLKDPATLKSLKSCLQGYSELEEWEIRFHIHQPEVLAPGLSTGTRSSSTGHTRSKGLSASIEVQKKSTPPPDSLVALEAKAERARLSQIDSEARSDPLVQSALSVFEGSSIEKVAVLKK